MNRGIHIGNPFGIGLFVHWTFALLLVWVGFLGLSSGGFAGAVFSILLIVALFACVTLHELGHSLAARRYGIPTRSITLYPIGGVAALARIPENPKQELVIALAGPIVNVVIAAFLFPIAGLMGFALPQGMPASLPQLVTMLMATNIALVVFNMLPAFPMDGGRVLRALLAFGGNYQRATNIAAGIGQGVAVLFVLAGLGIIGGFNQMLILIGGFVFLAAGSERVAAAQRSMSWSVPSSSFPQHTWVDSGTIPEEYIEIIPPEATRQQRRRRWHSLL